MQIYEYLQKKFKLTKREKYRSCPLSNRTKEILCDIGLPTEPLHFIQFHEEIENIIADEKHIIIGSDLGTDICVNEKDEVVSIDPEKEYPTRFVNKNLETFLGFIVIFLLYEEKLKNADDNEINQVIQEIRKEFYLLDMQALSNEENWWPIILEQIML